MCARPIRGLMARVVSKIDAGRLTIREGGGRLALFGLPFAAAGAFVMLGSLGIIPIQRSGNMSTPAAVLFGLVFALVGGSFITSSGSIAGWFRHDRLAVPGAEGAQDAVHHGRVAHDESRDEPKDRVVDFAVFRDR